MKHSRSRVIGLSDGIFAFAATLMVVDVGTTLNLNQLDIQIPSFVSFGIAFFVMMLLWKAHYNFFQRTKYLDNTLITINTFLLFTILFYLFPLKTFLNSIIQQKALSVDKLSQLFILYGLGFVLIFLCFSLLYFWAYKKDASNKQRLKLLFYYRHFGIFVITGLISVLLAYFKVGLGIGFPGFVYATLGPTCFINGVLFRRTYPQVFT